MSTNTEHHTRATPTPTPEHPRAHDCPRPPWRRAGLHRVRRRLGQLVDEATALHEERIVVNMGPQHPSTHGVLRLILELDGETVTEARAGIGYLHTGIEKNMEFRTWTQGVTFCTRMDYLTPMFQETAYCLAIEKLLGITDDIPERASAPGPHDGAHRISSHLVAIGTGGMEMGATTVMTVGFRERERILSIFEMVTGLRMNNAYIRPGGVAQDLPPEPSTPCARWSPRCARESESSRRCSTRTRSSRAAWSMSASSSLTGCMALGITGPVLRSTGLPHDLRKSDPYCGYETYDFDVITRTSSTPTVAFRVRIDEMYESLKIVEQAPTGCRRRGQPGLRHGRGQEDRLAGPAGPRRRRLGNSLDHIREIMGTSMESLIHHFKLVTEGFRVPPGQAYVAVESAKGELGCHVVSDGGTRPYRAHFRDPSFNNLQAVAAMCEGGQMADVIVAVASIDPVMGGVDR